MANNRMYLISQPSGLAIGLGKRMGWGWYVGAKPLDEERMNRFFDLALDECAGEQDAFFIVLETNDDWEFVEMVEPDMLRFKRKGADMRRMLRKRE